jgi:hypothetical protein
MLVDVIFMRMMEMPIMQIINVVPMFDRGMTATRAMCVIVAFVNVAFHHFRSPSANLNQQIFIMTK